MKRKANLAKELNFDVEHHHSHSHSIERRRRRNRYQGRYRFRAPYPYYFPERRFGAGYNDYDYAENYDEPTQPRMIYTTAAPFPFNLFG